MDEQGFDPRPLAPEWVFPVKSCHWGLESIHDLTWKTQCRPDPEDGAGPWFVVTVDPRSINYCPWCGGRLVLDD